MNRRLKVLFVCAVNIQRSVTAEKLYSGHPQLEVRSAGVHPIARKRVDEDDLKWADVIFVMELEHKLWIETRFAGVQLPPMRVLNIPDRFEYMDPRLQDALRELIDPAIAEVLASMGEGV